MAEGRRYLTLDFTDTFLQTLVSADFTTAERRRFLRALALLDTNEQHPSLRVHQLQGRLAGVWSASPSDELRMTFERHPGGRKLLLTCSRHYRS